MPETIRLKLFEEDFQKLVKGEVVKMTALNGQPVEFILADIGFDRIAYALERAKSGV